MNYDDLLVLLIIRMFLIVIFNWIVLEKINKLKIFKVIGFDGILFKFLKLVGKIIVLMFVDMYNYSIVWSIVFFLWKIVRLLLIFKKDDEIVCGNYWLVFLLSVFSKILEVEINDRLV